MTRAKERETRQSLSIHNKIRKACFVPMKFEESETFKYDAMSKIKHQVGTSFISYKRKFNSVWQGALLWLNKVKWKKSIKDSSMWLTEAFIEGFTANFATWQLLGFKFDPLTILAHGIVIKQGLDIVRRLRYGSTSKLS